MKSNDDDRDRVVRILALIDEDDRRWLEDRLAAPWLRQARRLARRDALIRQLGMQYHGFSKVRPLIAAIAGALSTYLTGMYRFERDAPPPNPRRGLLWAILTENKGRLPSASTIRDALAGVQKTGRTMCTPAGIPRPFGKSGTKRDARGGAKADHRQRR
ncbi:MAG TPA: hypothetical protein VJX48_09115 [Xanthobacteraceae bacterium]|nr:hypothetical protein [Xanthobacteraceae bacterium]